MTPSGDAMFCLNDLRWLRSCLRLPPRRHRQPFRNNVPVGLCLAHNGHLSNGHLLREDLSTTRHFNTDSDTELISELLGMELAARRPSSDVAVSPSLLFDVVETVMSRCRGGYAVTVLINGLGILAFRDPHGVRPLCLGARPGSSGSENGVTGVGGAGRSGRGIVGIGVDGRWGTGKMDLAVASESSALTGLGFTLRRDVGAGEAVFLDVMTGSVTSHVCSPAAREKHGAAEGDAVEDVKARFKPCLFEYVYMARPDSIIDGVPVYKARVAMGLRLADKIAREIKYLKEVDLVVPVPETSRISAMHCAARLGLPFEEGLTKNRYVGRTFIMPGQSIRRQNVRKKLSAVSSVLEGRCVLIVDDSIVRGTTSREIVRIVREAGARRVYFCSASPPVRHPNCYGIDLPRQSELLAFGLDEAEIAEAIGADKVIFQATGIALTHAAELRNTIDLEEADLKDLEECIDELRPGAFPDGFENSMFTGEYLAPTDRVDRDPRDDAGVSIGGGSIGGVGGSGAGGAVVDVI